MNSAPYFSGKPPCDSTLTGPARLTSPCSITILTPGCSGSVVLNTVAHSCALSMAYFSVTCIVARSVPSSGSTSAISPPVWKSPAVAASVDSVMGIGQNRPLAMLHAVAHALPVGVRHEAFERREAADAEHDDVALSRELTRTRGSDCARCVRAATPRRTRAAASTPCSPSGLTKLLIGETLCCDLGGRARGTAPGHPDGRGSIGARYPWTLGKKPGRASITEMGKVARWPLLGYRKRLQAPLARPAAACVALLCRRCLTQTGILGVFGVAPGRRPEPPGARRRVPNPMQQDEPFPT